ncbi:MAG TPA: hypothetical protein VL426_03615 [Candidatus Binatia bacterium]|jgi:endonuclease YncB( thermonuclease family)|nr:hypothetical protein [Candidatus Binatia bacterium]
MKRSIGIALAAAAIGWFLPLATHAMEAAPADPNLGKVLLDVSSHGEAWYVNPQTRARVYLGRPEEALERLKDRAVYIGFENIARIGEAEGQPCDADYAKAQAGLVLAPDDLVGAAWYVDPATGMRERLAVPDDAWRIMRAGTPASAATLAAIPVEASVAPEKTAVAIVKKVRNADTLELESGKTVRILSVTTPSNPELQEAAIAKLRPLVEGKPVLLERDRSGDDVDGAMLRHVHAGAANLGYELVRGGLAFHDIKFPDYKYAELYIVGSIDAARLRKGFWDNPSNRK